MLKADAVYQDETGSHFSLAMYDSRYVYLHRIPDGHEIILEHPDFNSRLHDGTLKQVYHQPEIMFPKKDLCP